MTVERAEGAWERAYGTQSREGETGLDEGRGRVRRRIAGREGRIGGIAGIAAGRLAPEERAGSLAWRTCAVAEAITERRREGKRRTRGRDECAEEGKGGGEEWRSQRREELRILYLRREGGGIRRGEGGGRTHVPGKTGETGGERPGEKSRQSGRGGKCGGLWVAIGKKREVRTHVRGRRDKEGKEEQSTGWTRARARARARARDGASARASRDQTEPEAA